jgi:DNA-binding LacI/PurR family transcriptional regulator
MARQAQPSEPKHLVLTRRLEAFIRRSKPGDRLPSYTEMMRQYEVGQVTIDRALREFDGKGWLRREHGRGIFISERATQRQIGIVLGRNIFSGTISPIYQELIRLADIRAETAGHHVSYFLNTPQVVVEKGGKAVHRDLLDALQEKKLDGGILLLPRGTWESRWLWSHGVPTVTFTSDPAVPPAVGYDYDAFVRLGVEALATAGCRSVALITMTDQGRTERLAAELATCTEAAATCGIEFRPEWLRSPLPHPPEDMDDSAPSNEEYGYRAFRELTDSGRNLPVDGIISNDDMTTRGILTAMREYGLQAGREVQVATHVNRGTNVLFGYSGLLHLEANPQELIDAIFTELEAVMNGEDAPTEPVLVQPHLVAAPPHPS